MNQVTEAPQAPAGAGEGVVSAPFFVRGELIEGHDVVQRSRDLGVTFATPKIPLDRVVPPRTEVPPLLNVPLAEIVDYQTELKAMTGGEGRYTIEFSHYEPVPAHVQKQLVESYKPRPEED